MKTIKRVRTWAAVVLGCLASAAGANAQTQQLPIDDFLAAQAAVQVTFWTDPITGGVVAFDMFGTRNAALGLDLGTSISGGVSIRDLGDGTEQVKVELHVRDAACWGFVNAVPAFGRTPAQIAGGFAPSLGRAYMQFEFTQPAGNPLQTWNVIAFGGPPIVLQTVKTTILCQDGELRAGSGFPEGTTGFAQTTQVGVLSTGVPAGCPPEKEGDCFPVERIQFKPDGQ